MTLVRAAAVAVSALLALSACSRAPRHDDRARPPEHRGGTVPLDAAAPPSIDAGDAADDCVTACVRSRQMEAVGIDYIRRTCAETCAAPPSPSLP